MHTHRRPLIVVALCLALGGGCASSEGEAKTPSASAGADAGATPRTTPATSATIASVQMIEDCPHQDKSDPPPPPPPAAPAQDEPSHAMPRPEPGVADEDIAPGDQAKGDGDFDQCTQSRVQLSLANSGKTVGTIKIVAARLFQPGKSAVLGTMQTRKPANWSTPGAYVGWDETVPAGEAVKASYKLSQPDWSKINAKLGNTYGQMFELELDIEIDGVKQTVRSPEFSREEPHVVVT